MKHLSLFKCSYQNGKELKKEHVRDCKVIDNVADNLVIDTPHLIDEIKKTKNGKIITIDVWEEVKPIKKIETKK